MYRKDNFPHILAMPKVRSHVGSSGSGGSGRKCQKKDERHDGSGKLELHLVQKHAKKPMRLGYYKCAEVQQ